MKSGKKRFEGGGWLGTVLMPDFFAFLDGGKRGNLSTGHGFRLQFQGNLYRTQGRRLFMDMFWIRVMLSTRSRLYTSTIKYTSALPDIP